MQNIASVPTADVDTDPDLTAEAVRADLGGTRRVVEISERTIPGLVAVADAAAAIFGFSAIYGVYLGGHHADPLQNLAVAVVVAALMIGAFRYLGLYDFETLAAWPRRTRAMLMAAVAILLIVIALAFALKISEQYSRLWFAAGSVTAIGLMWLLRGGVAYGIQRWSRAGHLKRRIAVVGASAQAGQFIARCKAQNAPWTSIVGVFDDRTTRIQSLVDGVPVLGDIDALVMRVRHNDIDEVVVALPWSADRRLFRILNRLRELPVDVHLGPDLVGYHIPAHSRRLLAGLSVLQIASTPFAGWSGVVKLLEDKILATLLLVLLSPVMLLIALAIKLDSSGPVLFRQERYGFNNEVMNIYKFRTMYCHRSADGCVPQATRYDARTTRVGRILRRASFDELPQLFNVLEGTMSLVGPRPHAVAHNEQFAPLVHSYHSRHKVKPGITGWAQVNDFRGETDTVDKMQARVDHDIYYIENWSLWFDLMILLKTTFVFWGHRNAY